MTQRDEHAFNRRGVVQALGAASLAAALPADADAKNLSDAGALKTYLEGVLVDHKLKSLGFLLCDMRGDFFKESFGTDTAESQHLLASATKLTSATTVMTLVDEGKIGLDDTIGKYLPQFGPNRRVITVRQLLSQTHGLPFSHKAIAAPQVDNRLTLAQAIDEIAKEDTLDYKTGTKHLYAPAMSYHILGRIAEVAAGEEWETLFHKRVGDPLAMNTFDYGPGKNPRIGGGAKCALQDYGNLVQMHVAKGKFNGKRILSAALVAEMQKDQLHGIPFTPSPAAPNTVGYGLAWWFFSFLPSGEAKLIAVPGAFGATPFIEREHQFGGFLLVEEAGPRLPEIMRFFPDVVAKCAGLMT